MRRVTDGRSSRNYPEHDQCVVTEVIARAKLNEEEMSNQRDFILG